MAVKAALDRAGALRQLSSQRFDLIVIGGGITGAGIAREAALGGYSVALVEAHDFASGTSSRSSKLIHGGLRYLAMGDFSLVRSTARERQRVHQMAPHLAEPNWLMLPSQSWTETLKYRMGVNLYERLGDVPKSAIHSNWGPAEIAEGEPLLRVERYPRACVYQEFVTDDARLVLATVRAAAAAGAVVVNHTEVTGLLREHDRAAGVLVRDQESGERFPIRGEAVVNAAGPWAGSFGLQAGSPLPKALQLSKGVHLVLPRSRLPVEQMALLPFSDGRLVFVVPRDEIVWVGTTDTPWDGDPAVWPTVETEEVEYLLKPLSDFYRVDSLSEADVAVAWAGLRPLIAAPGRAPKEMSRRDEVWVGKDGLISIAGGKLTGFRHMAAEVMATVSRVLGRPAPPGNNLTALPGGAFDGDCQRLANGLGNRANVDSGTALRLARMYGSEASEVLALGPEPLAGDARLLRGEVRWAVQTEGARTLEDVLYRRARLSMFGVASVETEQAAAAEMADVLGWDETRQTSELDAIRKLRSAQESWRAA